MPKPSAQAAPAGGAIRVDPRTLSEGALNMGQITLWP